MPSALRVGPYRFFFYSADGADPSHVHVEREEKCAKFWLDPVRLETSGWFRRAEINTFSVIARRLPTKQSHWQESSRRIARNC